MEKMIQVTIEKGIVFDGQDLLPTDADGQKNVHTVPDWFPAAFPYCGPEVVSKKPAPAKK